LISSQAPNGGYKGLVEPADGILGMSRNEQAPTIINYTMGSILNYKLLDESVTTSTVFAFFLAKPPALSHVDLNGYIPGNIKVGMALNDADWLTLN
jgi:hypothetical protein